MCIVKNTAKIDDITAPEVQIPISRDPKLFIKKYGYWEGQPTATSVEKGKDFGFTIAFGNYGEADVTTKVIDFLVVPAGVTLKVMSICTADNFKLTYQATGVAEAELTVGTILSNTTGSDITYTIKVKTTPPALPTGNENLVIPKHTVYCISTLFQLEN